MVHIGSPCFFPRNDNPWHGPCGSGTRHSLVEQRVAAASIPQIWRAAERQKLLADGGKETRQDRWGWTVGRKNSNHWIFYLKKGRGGASPQSFRSCEGIEVAKNWGILRQEPLIWLTKLWSWPEKHWIWSTKKGVSCLNLPCQGCRPQCPVFPDFVKELSQWSALWDRGSLLVYHHNRWRGEISEDAETRSLFGIF